MKLRHAGGGWTWSCMFCGSAGFSAFFSWLLNGGSRKLHPCKLSGKETDE